MDDLKMNIGLVGLTAAAVIWMGSTPGVGYLKRLGPAPLRFQPAPKLLSELGPLPPLAMKDPEPPLPEFLGPPMVTNAPPVVETTVTTPAVVAPMAPAEPIFTPQMFVHFFNDKNGTNQDYSVVVPYQFVPPPAMSIPAPPSSATYILK